MDVLSPNCKVNTDLRSGRPPCSALKLLRSLSQAKRAASLVSLPEAHQLGSLSHLALVSTMPRLFLFGNTRPPATLSWFCRCLRSGASKHSYQMLRSGWGGSRHNADRANLRMRRCARQIARSRAFLRVSAKTCVILHGKTHDRTMHYGRPMDGTKLIAMGSSLISLAARLACRSLQVKQFCRRPLPRKYSSSIVSRNEAIMNRAARKVLDRCSLRSVDLRCNLQVRRTTYSAEYSVHYIQGSKTAKGRCSQHESGHLASPSKASQSSERSSHSTALTRCLNPAANHGQRRPIRRKEVWRGSPRLLD